MGPISHPTGSTSRSQNRRAGERARGRFIISGGPASGKTTLIGVLARAGYACGEEVSRQIIREQQAGGGTLLPWRDMRGFAAECFARMTRQLGELRGQRVCFFDRGVPDLIGYWRHYHGGEAPREWLGRIGDYAPLVFMAPPWPEIFVNDAERPQTCAESVALHAQVARAYRECGFTLRVLPRVSAAKRAGFMLKEVAMFAGGCRQTADGRGWQAQDHAPDGGAAEAFHG